jgi:hypothetical protein
MRGRDRGHDATGRDGKIRIHMARHKGCQVIQLLERAA